MKYFLLIMVLLGAGSQARAQTPRPAARPDSLAVPLAASAVVPDTAAAIHRLFAARRRRLFYLAGGTALAGVATVVLVGSANKPYAGGGSGYGNLSSGPLLDFTGFEQASTGVVTALLVGAEMLVYKNTHGAEQQAVEAFQVHRLSRHAKRMLKPKYFRPTKTIP